jgi:tetratricopeptide (TPR) repeat protein
MPEVDVFQLSKLLIACPCLSTPAGRTQVVLLLKNDYKEFDVSHSVSATDKQDGVYLAQAILSYPSAASRILEIIQNIDGDTYQTRALAEFLQKAGKLVVSTKRQIATHNLPFAGRDPRFTGRETELASLRQTLLAGGAAALVVAKGQGGVGKTSLAREYAYRHLTTYSVIGWIDAETPTSLMTSYARLARLLKLPQADAREEEIVRDAVRKWLSATPDWLLIYDNADDPNLLKEWLPSSYIGHVLITSRTQLWQYAKPLNIALLSEDECLALLLQWLERSVWHDATERATAAELCRELGYLSLAIAQAGAFIFNTGTSVADYLNLFKQEHLALFEDEYAQVADRENEGNLAVTYRLNVEKLEKTNPAARDLLNLLAFFAPEPFRLELLKDATDKLPENLAVLVKSPLLLSKATAEIKRYSLAEVDAGKITLHRLVSLIIRERHLDETTHKDWVVVAVNVLYLLYPDPRNNTKWSLCQELLEHARATANHANKLHISTRFIMRLFRYTGLYLAQRANYLAAYPLLEQALHICEEEFGVSHWRVATSLKDLGLLLSFLKKYDTARQLLERSLIIREKIYGKNHVNVAQSLSNLGKLLYDIQNYSEAHLLLEKALLIDKKNYGEQHPYTATTMMRLGNVLTQLGDYDVARPLLEQALTIHIEKLGGRDYNVADSFQSLGIFCYRIKKLELAESHLEKALVIRQTLFGEEDPRTATAIYWLEKVRKAQTDAENDHK